MLPLCTRCVDVPDQQYLAEDARRAVQHLRRRGIDTFAFGIGNGPFSQLDQIFGERRATGASDRGVAPTRAATLY
jgi:nitric oxide reductase NorD protein